MLTINSDNEYGVKNMNTTLDMFFDLDEDEDHIKLGISQIEYSVVDYKPIIHIFGRTKDGELRRIGEWF